MNKIKSNYSVLPFFIWFASYLFILFFLIFYLRDTPEKNFLILVSLLVFLFSSGIILLFFRKNRRIILSAKELKAVLDSTDTFYKTIIDYSPDIIIRFNKHFQIIYKNKSSKILQNDSSEELKATNIESLTDDNIALTYWKNQIEKAITDKKQVEFILPIQSINRELIFDCRIIPETISDSKVCSVITIMRNITNEKIFERELIKAKEKAEESDRLKSAFLANLSHEIRTPMNGILGFCSLLKRPGLSHDKKDQFIELIETSGQQLMSIINDIIDISKIESGQAMVYDITIDLNSLLDEIKYTFENQAKRKGVEIITQKPLADTECQIISDETKIKQILYNLVSNSLKFTDKGLIEIGYEPNQDQILFFVKDTGIGISSEHFDLIFERFRQIDFSVKRKYGGTGLGLSISKALVELLKGEIWLESELGKGSCFYFTIPFKTAKDKGPVSEKNLSKEKTLKLNHKTILIAEDEDTNYIFLEELIAESGCHIIRAKTGIETIELCKVYPNIGMVLMDLKMPEMDGYKATGILKKLFPKLPVIAVTAYALSEDREKALKAGCDGYISKPINKKLLFETIEKFINF